MFRAELYWKTSKKTLKPVAFLVAFYIIPTFSKAGHVNQKKFKM